MIKRCALIFFHFLEDFCRLLRRAPESSSDNAADSWTTVNADLLFLCPELLFLLTFTLLADSVLIGRLAWAAERRQFTPTAPASCSLSCSISSLSSSSSSVFNYIHKAKLRPSSQMSAVWLINAIQSEYSMISPYPNQDCSLTFGVLLWYLPFPKSSATFP